MGCDKNGLALHYGNALGTDIPRPRCAFPCCVEKEKMVSKLIFKFNGGH